MICQGHHLWTILIYSGYNNCFLLNPHMLKANLFHGFNCQNQTLDILQNSVTTLNDQAHTGSNNSDPFVIQL